MTAIAGTLTPTPALTAIAAAPTVVALPADGRQHIISSGETLFQIAQRYGTTLEAIAALNAIADPAAIYAGQTLRIPADALSSPAPAASPPDFTATPAPPTATVTPINLTAMAAAPADVNGIPIDMIVLMPPEVQQQVRAIYALGQTLGSNPRAFSKIGDSIMDTEHFLSRFDQSPYDLGPYGYLQAVIDHFAGSFDRESAAVRVGMHTWGIFDPLWADPARCNAGENAIDCELRLHRPSIALIKLGTNDVGVPESFEENMARIVEACTERGVVPVLGTKANRHEGAGNINNDIIRQIATRYQVPLWDFDLLSTTLPGRGLDLDSVHLTAYYAHDYSVPTAYQRGHAMHNLSALIALERVLNAVSLGSVQE